MYPVVISALLWGQEWSGKSVLIHSNNLAAVHAIKKGCSHSPTICPILRCLFWTAACNQFILRAAYMTGCFKLIADSLFLILNYWEFKTLAPNADPRSDSSASLFGNNLPLNHPLSYLQPHSINIALQSYWTAWSFFKSFHCSQSINQSINQSIYLFDQEEQCTFMNIKM